MKAVILSAGQGKRLLPLTGDLPKCMLPVRGDEPVLGAQLRALARAGIEHAVVVTGFGAESVEGWLAGHPVPGLRVETLFNPFHALSDNLVSCWLARGAMDADFLLLNGDTLFADTVLQTLLASPSAPLTVTVDHKPRYDEDDMKVSLDARGRLLAVAKDLPPASVSGESIGLLAFREDGPKRFVEALEQAVRHPASLADWYLAVIDRMARRQPVETVSIRGRWWQEIDAPADLDAARRALARQRGDGAHRSPSASAAAISFS